MLKDQNKKYKSKLWDLKKYENIGCVHYNVETMNDVKRNCKVTKRKIKTFIESYIKDIDYLFSLQVNVDM